MSGHRYRRCQCGALVWQSRPCWQCTRRQAMSPLPKPPVHGAIPYAHWDGSGWYLHWGDEYGDCPNSCAVNGKDAPTKEDQ